MAELTPRDTVLYQYDPRDDEITVFLYGPGRPIGRRVVAFPATTPVAVKDVLVLRGLRRVLQPRGN